MLRTHDGKPSHFWPDPIWMDRSTQDNSPWAGYHRLAGAVLLGAFQDYLNLRQQMEQVRSLAPSPAQRQELRRLRAQAGQVRRFLLWEESPFHRMIGLDRERAIKGIHMIQTGRVARLALKHLGSGRVKFDSTDKSTQQRVCPQCGTVFPATSRAKAQQYCSTRCAAQSRVVTRTFYCLYCHQPQTVHGKATASRKYCNQECFIAHLKQLSRERHKEKQDAKSRN